MQQLLSSIIIKKETGKAILVFIDIFIRQTGFVKMFQNAFQALQVGYRKIDLPGGFWVSIRDRVIITATFILSGATSSIIRIRCLAASSTNKC